MQDGFFEYLRRLDCSDIEIYSISEGSVVFPKVPLMRIEGPVAVSHNNTILYQCFLLKHLNRVVCWIFSCTSLISLMIACVSKVVQLLETPFVNLINYASLVTTNAARHRFVAGRSKILLEFGLRRAQVVYLSYYHLYILYMYKL